MSLKYLMGNCADFQEEETIKKTMGRAMGILVGQWAFWLIVLQNVIVNLLVKAFMGL